METKQYTKNSDITILWTPEKCTHAGVCARTLPDVYKPRDKPWINPLNATAEELKNQINKCPSGALGFILHTENNSNDGNKTQ
jgi:uncharacterized Fe-S cluster protein YjdI